MTICKDCYAHIVQRLEKAVGMPRDEAWELVWAEVGGGWVCPKTGNEHRPRT